MLILLSLLPLPKWNYFNCPAWLSCSSWSSYYRGSYSSSCQKAEICNCYLFL